MSSEATIQPPRAIPRELGLALLWGGLFAASPLSSGSRLAASLVGGALAAGGLFAYRWLARPAPGALHEASAPRLAEPDRTLWAGALLFLILMIPAIMGLLPWYTESVWRNGHGLLLPIVIVAVARVAIHDLGPAPREGSAWGLALLAPGLLLILFDVALHSLYLSVIGATLAAAGFLLVFLGPRWTRALAIPCAMLLFFLPLSSGMAGVFELPIVTATGSEWILRTLGFPVLRDTVTLALPSGVTYGISIRCSGFGIAFGGAALSIAYGAVIGSWPRTLLLLGATLPLTILANAARVAGLLVVCEWLGVRPDQSAIHGFSGIAAYLGVMLALSLLAGRTARRRLIAG